MFCSTRVTHVIGLFFALLLGASQASTMEFIIGGTDHRDADAQWIQAEGAIDAGTVERFIAYLEREPSVRRIRFNSPGGNLMEGIRLGEELRRRGFATEVGGHEPHPDWPNMPYWDFTRRTPGICASACAYAFMGGIERRISLGSLLGVHQFYTALRGEGSDDAPQVLIREGIEQEISSVLLDYMLRMGVNGRVLVNAGLRGPDEMHWIEAGEEALELGLLYEPTSWLDWNIRLSGDGVVAESVRADGEYEMNALCVRNEGAYFNIIVSDVAVSNNQWSLRTWLVNQCLPQGSASQGPGVFKIIGNVVAWTDIRILERPGGFELRFPLGSSPIVEGDPSFQYLDAPFMACATDRFIGTRANMERALRIAFRNCIQ